MKDEIIDKLSELNSKLYKLPFQFYVENHIVSIFHNGREYQVNSDAFIFEMLNSINNFIKK